MPGAALLAVSRGIIEADGIDPNGIDPNNQVKEFGLDGVKQSLQDATVLGARELCLTILQAARMLTPRKLTGMTATQNDLTALTLVRAPHKPV